MNKNDVVAFQHALKTVQAVTFDNGQQTLLTPARWVPELADGPAIDLAGARQVAYWLFCHPAKMKTLFPAGLVTGECPYL